MDCEILSDVNTDEYALPKEVVETLRSRDEKVSFAESCTGGFIAKRITDIPGSADAFECGLVTYSARIKGLLANVNGETIETYGVVSRETAEEMANGVRKVASSDYGVGITGVAGPGPDADGNPAGMAWVAVSKKGKTVSKLIETHRDDRSYNRFRFSSIALEMLLAEING